MLAKHERTKYELAAFDDFPMVAMGRRRAKARAIAHARLWLGSHCPLPEPMFNVATFFARA
jgi:hypothetical protein